MKTEDKAGLTVQNEPEVVFLPLDLHHGFIGVPLVRVEIERRNELYGDVLEHGGEAGTPVTDDRMGYPDIHHGTQNQSDIAEGVLAQVEHTQGHEDYMDGIAHPLEIRLTEQFGHGWGRNGRRLWYEHGMAAFFVAAGIVGVMLSVVMQEGCFPANWAGWVMHRSCVNTLRGLRRPLMPTLLTLVLLMTMRIFSVAIKVRSVVALRAAYLV